MKMTLLLLSLLAACALFASDPKLNIAKQGTNAVVWVSGGTSNTQYWVRTSNDYTVDSTNSYNWNRFYSSDFYPNTAKPVFDPNAPTNTAVSKPMRFFK